MSKNQLKVALCRFSSVQRQHYVYFDIICTRKVNDILFKDIRNQLAYCCTCIIKQKILQCFIRYVNITAYVYRITNAKKGQPELLYYYVPVYVKLYPY